MCAKNHLLIFSSFLDIGENVEWPRFFWTTRYICELFIFSAQMALVEANGNIITTKSVEGGNLHWRPRLKPGDTYSLLPPSLGVDRPCYVTFGRADGV